MKITKQQSKLHDEALAVLSLTRELTLDDKEFVYENFNPMATNNVGKGAIFFTPVNLAWEFGIVSACDYKVIDLAAGIGVLSFVQTQMNNVKRQVAIEINPEFVEIGRKLLPNVEWYQGSIFDQDLLMSIGTDFTLAISNPPFGNIPSKVNTEWLITKGPAEQLAIEVAIRMAYSGGIFILPEGYCSQLPNGPHGEHRTNEQQSSGALKIRDAFGDVYFHRWASDIYDEVKWQGANPNTVIIDIVVDDVEWEQRPYGLGSKQGVMF